MSEFGDLLRSLRKEKKITQRKLAELIGIDFTYISKIENGSMEPPAENKIIKMAEVFETDKDKLLLAAKKVPNDFKRLITENENVPSFLRSVPNLSKKQWEDIQSIVDDKE
ncbi:helix-turn-helix domain-containing protein [Virgibacillus sp. DJP39]|uniref:helix-turn-helix domain-containing protein n=1 Tax=Virgibacillus sp. DJP39 TaxID=3409790 RepID=UPI003BB571D9